MSGKMKYCCESMKKQLEHKCEVHRNAFDCLDRLIYYSKQMDEYGIIFHDGGSSYLQITFCPWCGTKLPESKRDLWFSELAKLGYDSPFLEKVPKEFNSDKWWKNRSL